MHVIARDFDVIVVGEPLIEISTHAPFGQGVPAVMGISGDVVNAGAAAAAAGASVAMIARITDDELGDAVLSRLIELGINPDLIQRHAGQQGVYLQHRDPQGGREFSYARAGSVGSQLAVGEAELRAAARAGAVLFSGITLALSEIARSAALSIARTAGQFIYDPNFRSRLTTSARAAADLIEFSSYAAVVTPSAPTETDALLGETDPAEVARQILGFGARAVAVTCGSSGVHLSTKDTQWWQSSILAPQVVDQTGAGDVFAGTLTARLALGDPLERAAELAAAAASLAVGGLGGTGLVPTLEQTIQHAGSAK